ncbi:MAG: alpha-galactosidase, partial [Lentisphaeria bacterium]|nr:alpha-galactosidase [Lentisphaeria bacterium]
GSYTLSAAPFLLKDAAIIINYGKKDIPLKNWKFVSSSGEQEENTLLEYETKNVYGKYFLAFSVTSDEVTITLSAKLKKSLPHIAFYYFKEAKSTLPDHILSRSMNLPGGSSCAVLPEKIDRSKVFSSFDTTLTKDEKKHLFLSFPMAPDHFPKIIHHLKKQGRRISLSLTAEIFLQHFEGKEITLPSLTLKFSSADECHVYPSFQKQHISEKELIPPPCAWNSWDYYRWTVTEEEVLKNAEFIASDPVLSKHVKRIIIDDGWQYAYGEWVHNGLFPSGMKKLAAELTGMGFEPGLWIAPGIVENVSRIAQMKYDMLAQGEDGVPAMMFNCMERRGFILDPTNDDVHKFWFELFDNYASMGYKYFKLDFLALLTTVPRVKNNSIPRGRYLDMLFDTVTKAVKGRAKLMACGYPYLSGNPGTEAVRVGHDIHAKWDCIKANTPDVISLYPFNGKRWLNDPDFALCRGVETSDDPDLNKLRPCLVYNKKEGHNPSFYQEYSLATATENELEVLLSLVLVSAGIRTLSDNLPLLNASGLRLARKTVSAKQGLAGVPLDLFSNDLPSYYLQRLPEKGFRTLFINWTEEEKEYTLDLAKYGIAARPGMDFWKEVPVKPQNGILHTILAPHSCFLAEFL